MKIITLSFDDGTIHDAQLIDMLKTYRMPATFFLNSGRRGNEYMSSYTPYAAHEIGSHSINHPHISDLTLQEVRDDKFSLEQMSGQDVVGFAYPFGEYSEEAADMAQESGMRYARTVAWNTTNFDMPKDRFAWQPTCHYSHALKALREFNRSRTAQLFSIWGHSYEMAGIKPYDKKANWEYMYELLLELSMADALFLTHADVLCL